MSTTQEEVKAQGYIRLHNRKDDEPILFNAGYIVLCYGGERLAKDKSLQSEKVSLVKAFGESPFVVRETVDEIAEMILAAGIDVHGEEDD